MDIGRTTNRTLTISDDERRRHIYISGKAGTGKSTLLHNFIKDDLYNNRRFSLLDPHGDLARDVADITPQHLTNSVVYFDVEDPTHVVGFNPLQHVSREERSKVIAFRVGAEDALFLSREIDIQNPAALTDTPNFSAWVRLLQDGVPSSPHIIQTPPPKPDQGGRLPYIVSRTRARPARPRHVVEKSIARLIEDTS